MCCEIFQAGENVLKKYHTSTQDRIKIRAQQLILGFWATVNVKRIKLRKRMCVLGAAGSS